MPWKPSEPGEIPTLGYEAIAWIEEYLAHPLGTGEGFRLYREQEDFVLRWYSIDPTTGRWAYRRGLLGRPRGWGKSPLLAALSALESLAPIVPDGWDAAGQPVGKPWSEVRGEVIVQIAAVSEEQTRNTWGPLLTMLRDGPAVDEFPGLEPMETFVGLPGNGSIRQITASARTVKGAPPVFSVADQTEEWVPSNGGVALARVMRSNAGKGAVLAGRMLESPNAYIPGENSVAEQTANAFLAIEEGRTKATGILVDHREAPADTDMADEESLTYGLRVSYGDSAAHPDGCVIHDPPCPPGHKTVRELIDTVWDPNTDPQQARSDFLNQITHASDSWVSKPQLDAIEKIGEVVAPSDPIVLGFDGSRGRVKGKADATALIGCRVSDGHFFEVRVWEAPDGPQAAEWIAPQTDVDRTLRQVFRDHNVVGLYADPAGWSSQIARWEADLGSEVKVRASRENPFSVWASGNASKGKSMTEAVEALRMAVVNEEVSHDGSAAFCRHMLNARRRANRTGYLLYKQYPDSPEKIDAAYAATLAYRCRNDALAKGADTEDVPFIPMVIR